MIRPPGRHAERVLDTVDGAVPAEARSQGLLGDHAGARGLAIGDDVEAPYGAASVQCGGVGITAESGGSAVLPLLTALDDGWWGTPWSSDASDSRGEGAEVPGSKRRGHAGVVSRPRTRARRGPPVTSMRTKAYRAHARSRFNEFDGVCASWHRGSHELRARAAPHTGPPPRPRHVARPVHQPDARGLPGVRWPRTRRASARSRGAEVLQRPALPAPPPRLRRLRRGRRLGGRGTGRRSGRCGARRHRGPLFRRPLWLQTRCAGRILWAYDEEHVDALAAYVGARLRERHASPTRAMFARLPVWMKAAERRSEVLAGLATLRALARLSAPADRSDAAHERGDRPRHHGSRLFRGGPY